MEHLDAARVLDERYPQILREFHEVLRRYDLQELTVNLVEFLHRPTLTLVTSGCPEGTTPMTRCVAKPGGGVHCFTVCMQSSAAQNRP